MSRFDFEVRYEIARYLGGELSIADFRRWFLPVAWQVGEPNAPESPVAKRVELRLAEYLNGHWSEDDLRAMFGQLIGTTSGLSAEIHVPNREADNVRVPVSTEGLQGTGIAA